MLGKSVRVIVDRPLGTYHPEYKVFTWQGPITVLVILAKVLSTIANGMGNPKTIRYMNLGIMMLWNVHDIIVFSIVGVLCNMATIVSVLIAIFRIDKKKKEISDAQRSECN